MATPSDHSSLTLGLIVESSAVNIEATNRGYNNIDTGACESEFRKTVAKIQRLLLATLGLKVSLKPRKLKNFVDKELDKELGEELSHVIWVRN